MRKKQLIIPLALTVITIFFDIFILTIIPATEDMTRFYPTVGIYDGMLLLFMPFIYNLISVPVGILFTFVYFGLSKILRKNYKFNIIESEGTKTKGNTLVTRTILPMLLAIAIGLFLNNYGWMVNSKIIGFDSLTTILFGSLIALPFCSALIIPIWIFQDCNIVEIKKINREFKDVPDVSHVGQFYNYVWRGFAGLTTPILFYLTFSREWAQAYGVIQIIILFFPILLIGYFTPLTIIYERIFNKVESFVFKVIKLEKISLEEIFK